MSQERTQPQVAEQAGGSSLSDDPKFWLYVGCLKPDVTEKDLLKTFRQVVPFSILLPHHGIPWLPVGSAYLSYKTDDDAQRALEWLDFGHGEDMRVIHSLLDLTGRNVDKLITGDRKGKSKRLGFVDFEQAVEALNGRQTGSGKVGELGSAQPQSERGAKLTAKLERSGPEEEIPYNIFVTNLDLAIDETTLKELFAMFGEIQSCKVVVDKQGKSQGFGFVAFSSAKEANLAISEMCGRIVFGIRPLYVVKARNKEEGHAARLQGYSLFPTEEAKFTQGPTLLGVDHPDTREIGQQSISHGQQPRTVLDPPQRATFSNQQQMPSGITPGGRPVTNFDVSSPTGRQVQLGHQGSQGGRRDDVRATQQHCVPRRGNQPLYNSYARNAWNVNESSVRLISSMRGLGLPSVKATLVHNTAVAQPSESKSPLTVREPIGEDLYREIRQQSISHGQQPRPAVHPPQPAAFSNQQQMSIPGLGPPGPGRQVQQGRQDPQRGRGGYVGVPRQHRAPRGGNQALYNPNAKNASNVVHHIAVDQASESKSPLTVPEIREPVGEGLYQKIGQQSISHGQQRRPAVNPPQPAVWNQQRQKWVAGNGDQGSYNSHATNASDLAQSSLEAICSSSDRA